MAHYFKKHCTTQKYYIFLNRKGATCDVMICHKLCEKQRKRWGTAVKSIDCILTEYRRKYNTLKVHEILIIIKVVYWDSLRPVGKKMDLCNRYFHWLFSRSNKWLYLRVTHSGLFSTMPMRSFNPSLLINSLAKVAS